jgi:hypothetical protein
VTESGEPSLTESNEAIDPRSLLAEWANGNDEWVRLLVGEVIATGRPASEELVAQAYQLFRQEKALDERQLPAVGKLSTEARQDERGRGLPRPYGADA